MVMDFNVSHVEVGDAFQFTRKLLTYEKNISVDTMTVVLHKSQHSSAIHHVLYLIGILEGPATFDSSLEVSQNG